MYEFGILWLLAMVAWKLGDLVNLWAVHNRRLETLVSFGLGVGAAEALQWNLFDAYGQDITAAWLGVLGSGLIIGAAATVLRTTSQLAHALIHRVDAEVIPRQFNRNAA